LSVLIDCDFVDGGITPLESLNGSDGPISGLSFQRISNCCRKRIDAWRIGQCKRADRNQYDNEQKTPHNLNYHSGRNIQAQFENADSADKAGSADNRSDRTISDLSQNQPLAA
jgi:hypothetical protein